MTKEELTNQILDWARPLLTELGEDWLILGDFFNESVFKTLISRDKLFIIQEELAPDKFSFICYSNNMDEPLVAKYWRTKDLANKTRVVDFSSIVKFYKELYE